MCSLNSSLVLFFFAQFDIFSVMTYFTTSEPALQWISGENRLHYTLSCGALKALEVSVQLEGEMWQQSYSSCDIAVNENYSVRNVWKYVVPLNENVHSL